MQIQSSDNNKRIAKNTLYLYIRMGIIMLVQLYTSRVVLDNLGVENYGIYNVVGSFVVAFTFISGPLGTATQRFLNFELGRDNGENLNKVFNISLYTYCVLSFLLVLVIEIAGVWFMQNKMRVPVERIGAAQWAFHLSVVSLVLGLLKTPYESMVVAHERMSYYAYVSVVEVGLKLLNAASLAWLTIDKLKLYAVNQVIISLVVAIALWGFCHKNFRVKVVIRKVKDNELFFKLLNFSGWSLFGSVASMSANQGLNVLLNMFFGVVVNAAMGIASQINTAITQFVSNFQIAFRPQIVKYYAADDFDSLRKLIHNSSKYSYLLLLGLICPFIMNIDFVLRIWLKNPPTYTNEFTIFMLIYALLETLSAPMWMTVQATGKIRRYQLIISSLIFMNIILSYVFLKLGFPPSAVLFIKCFMDIMYLVVRLVFMKLKVQLSISLFITDVIYPVGTITILSVAMIVVEAYLISDGFARLFGGSLMFVLVYCTLIYTIGLRKQERVKFVALIKNSRNK